MRRFLIMSITTVMLLQTSCTTTTSTVPSWTTSNVDFGQGQLRVGIRFRWVAQSDPTGALIRTPEGGTANVRIFFCGRPVREIKAEIRSHLSSRLIRAELRDDDRLLIWRWRDKGKEKRVLAAAVARHGPLLISVTSETIQPDDLGQVARRIRLDMPIPSIKGCLPLCEEGVPCNPQSPDES
jgi:hypothetical protein